MVNGCERDHMDLDIKNLGNQIPCNRIEGKKDLDKKNKIYKQRKARGTSIAEMPIVLFIFVLGLLLPLIDLSCIALRSSFVHTAARMSLQSAARAKSFASASADGEASALQIAANIAETVQANGLSGFTLEKTELAIIGVPIKAGAQPIYVLNAPLDKVQKSDYVYQLEVRVAGKIAPLLKLNSEIFGDVPGLTTDFPVSAKYKQFAEHPNGLTR